MRVTILMRNCQIQYEKANLCARARSFLLRLFTCSGNAHAHVRCQECRSGTSILHGPVHNSAASPDSLAGRGCGLLPLVVVSQGREDLTLDGSCRGHYDSAHRFRDSRNVNVLPAHDRSGQGGDWSSLASGAEQDH